MVNVVLTYRNHAFADFDTGKALLPVGIVRPRWVGIGQMPILDAPMHAVAVCSGNDAHAVRVSHCNGSTASSHVAAY